MKKILLLIAFISITNTSKAQLYEVGVFAGGSNYIGDIGAEYYVNPNNLMGGIIYKKNVNPRIAVRAAFTYAKISANDANAINATRKSRSFSFKNNIKELALGVEFNYFEYNISDPQYTHTPYLLLEIAAFNYHVATKETALKQYEYASRTDFAIPFGIGYKTKLYQNIAIAVELRARYTFVDDIDYNNKNINSLTFGNPNSNDWYVFSGMSIVYTFGRPPCYTSPR